MKLLLSKAIFATTFAVLLASVNGRRCRSGFNTSIFGIPVDVWDDNALCSSTSEQSCFLGEVTLDASFLEDDISLTYGSCISTAYESTLECNSVFYGSSGWNVDAILTTVPNVEAQLENIINVFSADAAERVVLFLRNENGELDSLQVVEALFTAANVTIPENVKPVVTKLDTLILTLLLNSSELQTAANELLASFNELDTPDAAASQLLYALFNRTNIPVPDEFKPAIDNLPGFIAQYIQDLPNYQMVNGTLFNIISQISATPGSAGNVLAALLKEYVPADWNLNILFDSVPNLIDELAQGNVENLTSWNLNLLVAYSTTDAYTESLTNSTIDLMTRLGLNYHELPEEIQILMQYFPGYFYNFFPDQIETLQTVYFNVSTMLDTIDLDNADFNNFGTLLSDFGIDVNALGLAPIFSTLNSLYEPILSQNLTQLGINAIQALQDVSSMTTQTVRLGNSILDFLEKSNIEIPDGVSDIIISLPGLFIRAFPNEVNQINYIYGNISEGLDNYDPMNPNNAAIIKSVLNGLRTAGVPGEVVDLLQEASSRANASAPAVSLQSSIEMLNSLLPFEINEETLGLNALPEELRTLLESNFQYIVSFQLEVLKAFSRITPATTNFSSSVYDMLERFELQENITEAQRVLIDHQPGLLYSFFPSDPSAVDSVLYNISQIIDSVVPSPNMDFSRILHLYGIDISSPGMESTASSLNALFDLISTQNVTQFGIDSLNALKEASTSTTESVQLANSLITYLTNLGVAPDPTTEEIIMNIPGVFVSAFPQYVDVINTIYANISQSLDLYDPTNMDYQAIVMSSLQSLNGVLPANVQNLLQQLAMQVNISDPVGSLQSAIDVVVPLIPEENNQTVPVLNTLPELLNQLLQENYDYLNTWSLELLKSYSKITPESTRLSTAIIELAERFGLSENLTDEIKIFITYQAGYFYQLFSDLELNTVYLDYAFGNISEAIESIDPNSPVDLQGLLSLVPESALPTGVEALVPMLEGFIDVASTGEVDAIGRYALEALKNSSLPTTESMMLSNSIIAFMETINVTLTDELKEVIRYVPGIFTATYPDQVNMINAIYANISQGLDLADPTSANFALAMESLLTQLETLGLTLSNSAQNLIIQLPTKINISDPVGTLEALLEVSKAILPPEYNALVPLLNTLPSLLTELLNGNANYVTTWQIGLLEIYSITTNATEAFSNSVLNLISGFGLDSFLTDEVRTWITYQPGYFYQFFPNQTAELDYVFNLLAGVLQSMDPTQLNLQAVLSLIPANTTEVEFIIPALQKFLDTTLASGGDGTQILEAAVILMDQISENSTEGTELGESILFMLQTMNISLPQEAQDIITDIPGIFLALFPDQSEMIKSIYENAAQQMMGSFNIEQTINDTFSQLQATGVLVPQEVASFAYSLQGLLDAAMSGNVTAINQWLVNTLPLVSSPSTDASAALADSIRHVLRQIDGFEITNGVSAAIDYITTVPFSAVPSNDTTLISIYSAVTENLLKTNITVFDPASVNGAFADLSMIVPVQLQPFITSTEDLIIAVVTENMTALTEWGAHLQNQYCASNAITVDLSKAMYDTMVETYHLAIPASYQSVFECVPGILYNFLPNETATLNDIFQQVTLGMTNYTALLEIQLQQVGSSLTPENVAMLNLWTEMQGALVNGNITYFLTLSEQLRNLPVPDTELSTLVITMLSKAGVNVTEEIAMIIRQSSSSFYSSVPVQYISTFDIAFSSLNADIAANINLGTAIENALAAANVTVSERWIPVFDNAQALVDAIMSYDDDRINQAILGLMISYNASFPSDMLQYVIYQFRLQIAIQNTIESNSTTIPDEVFENAAEMYSLLLGMLNTTESELREMLLEAFPSGATFIQIFFQLDPRDALSISTKFASWLIDPERNVTTLTNFIRETAQRLFSTLNVDVGEFLRSLAQPTSCKYKACRTDTCNDPSLLNDVEAVLPPAITTVIPESTFIGTTIQEESTTVIETTASDITVPSNEETTTTASGRSSMSIFNLNFIMLCAIFSAKYLLS